MVALVVDRMFSRARDNKNAAKTDNSNNDGWLRRGTGRWKNKNKQRNNQTDGYVSSSKSSSSAVRGNKAPSFPSVASWSRKQPPKQSEQKEEQHEQHDEQDYHRCEQHEDEERKPVATTATPALQPTEQHVSACNHEDNTAAKKAVVASSTIAAGPVPAPPSLTSSSKPNQQQKQKKKKKTVRFYPGILVFPAIVYTDEERRLSFYNGNEIAAIMRHGAACAKMIIDIEDMVQFTGRRVCGRGLEQELNRQRCQLVGVSYTRPSRGVVETILQTQQHNDTETTAAVARCCTASASRVAVERGLNDANEAAYIRFEKDRQHEESEGVEWLQMLRQHQSEKQLQQQQQQQQQQQHHHHHHQHHHREDQQQSTPAGVRRIRHGMTPGE